MNRTQFFQFVGLAGLVALLPVAVLAFVGADLFDLLLGGTPATRWLGVLVGVLVAALAAAVAAWATPGLWAGGGAESAPAEEEPEAEPQDFVFDAETAGDAIISADATGRIVAFNREAEQMFGYLGQELFGEPLTRLMPERHREAHNAGVARVSGGGEQHIIGTTVELTGLRDTGEEFPLELSLSTWTRDRRRGYTAIIRDITARKRAEEALRSSEERLRRLLETAPDAVVVIDARGRIVSWNPAAQVLFGHAEEEVLGAEVILLMPERYRARHAAGMRRLQESGEARLIGSTVALHGLRSDGSEFPLELSLGTWTAGEQTFYSAIIRAAGPRPRGAAPD